MGGGQKITKNHTNIIKDHLKTISFYTFVPWKGTLTDARDGDGGGHFSFRRKYLKLYIFLNIFYTVLFILYVLYILIFEHALSVSTER